VAIGDDSQCLLKSRRAPVLQNPIYMNLGVLHLPFAVGQIDSARPDAVMKVLKSSAFVFESIDLPLELNTINNAA